MGQSTNNSPASTNILEKWFHLSEQGTTIKRELRVRKVSSDAVRRLVEKMRQEDSASAAIVSRDIGQRLSQGKQDGQLPGQIHS